MRWRMPAAALLVLAGCTPTPPLSERLQPWIGKTELQIVEAFGVPAATTTVDGVRFIQFTAQRTILAPTPAPAILPYGRWGGPGWAGGYPQTVVVPCDVTFALRQGVAESFSFRGEGCR
jgi:hypothetical protein